ncbi:cyclic nucleotide-binding/CBS domain-containing protein [Desertimonas flava]|uniref:CBS domain-containing protein n=1 Tax=Desertimonas flava TaxID=2064846 RepID=UPI000E35392C|nr:CBS domain-containing protein [Desertimonas flava]
MSPRPDAQVRSLEWAEPIVVDGSSSLRAAAAALDGCQVGALLVTGGRRNIGIVSERDVVAALRDGADPDRLRVDRIASRPVVTTAPDERLIDVARRLITDHCRHVVIVDGDEVVGILSMRDLLAVLIEIVGDTTNGEGG